MAGVILVLFLLQKHLKVLVEVKRAIPPKIALTPHDLVELLLQAFYVMQGFSSFRVRRNCLFCYTDCIRFCNLLLVLKTSLQYGLIARVSWTVHTQGFIYGEACVPHACKLFHDGSVANQVPTIQTVLLNSTSVPHTTTLSEISVWGIVRRPYTLLCIKLMNCSPILSSSLGSVTPIGVHLLRTALQSLVLILELQRTTLHKQLYIERCNFRGFKVHGGISLHSSGGSKTNHRQLRCIRVGVARCAAYCRCTCECHG